MSPSDLKSSIEEKWYEDHSHQMGMGAIQSDIREAGPYLEVQIVFKNTAFSREGGIGPDAKIHSIDLQRDLFRIDKRTGVITQPPTGILQTVSR